MLRCPVSPMIVRWEWRALAVAAILIGIGCGAKSIVGATADASSGNGDDGGPSGVQPSGSSSGGAIDTPTDGGMGVSRGADGDGGDASSAADSGCVYIDPPYTSTQSDPHNCGSNGNDCLGGACEDGGCTTLPAGALATGQLTPFAIAADETNVYWLNWGVNYQTSHGGGGLPVVQKFGAQVLECAVAGCNNRPTVLASVAALGGIPEAPSAIAVDAQNVYWTTSTSIQSCAISGCGCAPTTIASGLTDPTALAVGGGRVYWSAWTNGSPYTGQVESCPVGGCVGAPTLLAGALSGPLGVAVDTTDVYWVDTYGPLMECARSGCDAGPIALWSAGGGDGGVESIGVVADSTNLYWTNGGDGTVMQCAKSDCTATLAKLASGQANPSGIAVDATSVYWRGGANVYRCAIGGCNGSPDVVAAGASTSFSWDAALAVNSTRVFWTQQGPTSTDTRIMMADK